MDSNQAPPSGSKVFTLTEYLEEGQFEAYSCGNGRFIPGTPSAFCEVCFRIYKGSDYLRIEISDETLFEWLLEIPSLSDGLDNSLGVASISMDLLLPCYPEVKGRLAKDKTEGHSFHAAELFIRHFLREGSIFATFGFEDLHEKGILTELHFHDIQSRYRSISEDLDLLDEAIDRIEAQDVRMSSQPLMNEVSKSLMRTAIEERDPMAVSEVLATNPGVVDTQSLRLAIRFYEGAVFQLLLEHGAKVDETKNPCVAGPLYCAAKAGCIEAVQLLLDYGADKEGGRSSVSLTPLAGAVSGGHLEIVRYLAEEKGACANGNGYDSLLFHAIEHGGHLEIIRYLVEEKDANVNGDRYDSPLLHAIKHDQRAIINYLLRAGADLSKLKDRNDRKLAYTSPEWFDTSPRWVDTSLGWVDTSPGWLDTTSGWFNTSRWLNTSLKYNPGIRFKLPSALLQERQGAQGPQDFPERLLAQAAAVGDINAVKWLIEVGAKVNISLRHNELSLCLAARHGHLEVVRWLVRAGAHINPVVECDKNGAVVGKRYSPLAEAARHEQAEVAQFLSFIGATLLEDEERLSTTNVIPEYRPREWPEMIVPRLRDQRPLSSVGQFLGSLKYGKWSEDEVDVEDCQVVVALRAQERDKMARRLLTKVASSRKRFLNAGAEQDASAGLKSFVDQICTSSSVFRGGTRAIRDISEGYMPSSLSDVVRALQVANAMRSAVPPSKLVCSEKEFLDDIPRWASLLSPNDQCLLEEIAHHLWGCSVSIASQKEMNGVPCEETLMFLQELVSKLVRISGLFDHDSESPCGSHRLQDLRDNYVSARCDTNGGRFPLANWCPSRTEEAQQSLHAGTLKPPDPEWELNILARITVFVAGAIFGAIMLYLCIYKYGFSTLSLPILASDAEKHWDLNQVVARNCVIVAMYLGRTSILESGIWKSIDHVPPKPSSPSLVLPESPAGRAREQTAGVQQSYAGDCIMTNTPSAVGAAGEDGPPDCLPSLSSHLATYPSVTTISPSSMTTESSDSTHTGTSEDGTVRCEHCKSKFQLGKNGSRGRDSNLRKHIKSHHPDALPNYQRVIYECRWGCGAKDPYKSNMEAHETKYCAVTKGKQPRRRGKWRDARTEPF